MAKLFRLTAKRAEEIIGEVVTVVKRWPAEAKKLGISRGEQERMADAFRVAAGA